MSERLSTLIARHLQAPDAAAAVAAIIGTEGATTHLDEEHIAAGLDGVLAPRAIAHLLGCDSCAAQFSLHLDVNAVIPFGARRAAPSLLTAARPRVLFASVRTLPSGALEVRQASGITRVQPALTVRADRALEALSFRDHETDPRIELAIVTEPNPDRFSILVRWLGAPTTKLVARAVARGRTLAEIDIEQGSALLSNLRKSELRVDIRRMGDVLAIGWLHVEAA